MLALCRQNILKNGGNVLTFPSLTVAVFIG